MKVFLELEEGESYVTPLRVAEALIKCEYERPASQFEKTFSNVEIVNERFDYKELLEIAEYLQVFVKYNKID